MITHIKVKKHIDDNIALLNVDNNFKKFNLIYGYNGSGKTTFSRFFECLNEGKNLSFEKYTDCSINNSNVFDNYKNKIIVYNSDYIEKVLSEQHKKFQNAFSLNINAKESERKIKKLDEIIKKIKDLKIKCDENVKDLEQKINDVVVKKFYKELSVESGKIRERYKITNPKDFDINKIKTSLQDLKDYAPLSDEQQEKYKSALKTKPQEEELADNLTKQEEFKQSIEETNKILQHSISKSKDIEETLSKWITEGFTNFYDGNEKDKTICKFCEQGINDDILKKIESIAKSEYQTLIKIINEKISKIDNLKQQYLNKLNRLLSLNESGEIELTAIPNNLNDNKKEGFKKEQEKLKTKLLEFFDELINYKINFLVEKNKNPEKNYSYNGDLLVKHEDIRIIHQNINNLIKEDNEEKKNAKPNEARNSLIKNDVYKFINTQEYLTSINAIKEDLKKIINEYNSSIKNRVLTYNDNDIKNYLDNITIYSNEIQSISTKKEDKRFTKIETTILTKRNEIIKKFNQEKPDIAQINKNLELIIGNRGFCIEEYTLAESQLQFYKIKRHSTDNADKKERLKKFSEGEKTAICFAFYLTRVQESKEKDIIAVIDDPICSLDQNIFHNINESIIENIFKNTQIAQCYILTHSYHLSYLLANYLLSKDNDINKEQDINFFTIQNKLTEKSYKINYRHHIFTDEYSFLCRYTKELAEMTDNDLKDKDDYYFFSIINVLRRLCENFTKFKIKKDYLDDFEIIDNQIKTYALSTKTYTNYYSHAVKEKNNNFFALSNEEKRNIAKKILAVIKHIDEEHYNAYFS